MGWAHELKTVPERIVQARVARTGDGSYKNGTVKNKKLDKNSNTLIQNGSNDSHGDGSDSSKTSWGWDDVDTPKSDKQVTIIHCKKL